jgi:hypothetical protein
LISRLLGSYLDIRLLKNREINLQLTFKTAVSPSHTFPHKLHVTNTLLQTKLYIPPNRPQIVPRPHLSEKLKSNAALMGVGLIEQRL